MKHSQGSKSPRQMWDSFCPFQKVRSQPFRQLGVAWKRGYTRIRKPRR
jgi:hypothetical protein